jgi:sugar phosphate isomerase/epimerase
MTGRAFLEYGQSLFILFLETATMQRRHFLQTLSGVAIALSTTPAYAMDPIKRPKPGHLRLSLAAYSMRKYLQGSKDKKATMNLHDFVDYCFEHGLEGAELTSYYFPTETTDDYIYQLKNHCHLRGITVSGGAIRNDYCQPAGPKLTEDLEHTKLWIDRYAKLGAPVIRIFAGNQPAGADLEATLKQCAENCEVACRYAAEKGIILALENHGGVTATAEGLLKLVQQVQTSHFGINFDSGNFRSTDDPYKELEAIAPYAVNAQIKVDMYPSGKQQPTDLARVLSILRDAGYSGWVALEYEAEEEPREAIPRYLDELRKLIHV